MCIYVRQIKTINHNNTDKDYLHNEESNTKYNDFGPAEITAIVWVCVWLYKCGCECVLYKYRREYGYMSVGVKVFMSIYVSP